uniref:Uncharacterized protein n=1 Tax=Guillardia theta TaxID=55529 RepID=A0A6U6BM33_GUITH|mmetsp:Transcript_38622/g.121659  ORF Transcript_38622/g.121659 Transcript_38622/m.121659 type:complete len:1242 (+) Transcript_38622:177-3902(+)
MERSLPESPATKRTRVEQQEESSELPACKTARLSSEPQSDVLTHNTQDRETRDQLLQRMQDQITHLQNTLELCLSYSKTLHSSHQILQSNHRILSESRQQQCAQSLDKKEEPSLDASSTSISSDRESQRISKAEGRSDIIVLDSEDESESVNNDARNDTDSTAAMRETAEPPKEDDGELVLVSATGGSAADLPHPRCLCQQAKFIPHCCEAIQDIPREIEDTNKLCCHNCYCFVCDRRAHECQRWERYSADSANKVMWKDNGHCNADSKHEVWKSLRSVYRVGLLPSSMIADVLKQSLKESHLCAIYDGTLRIHQSFVQYHRGEEETVWNEVRRRMEVKTRHKLRHLGSCLMPVATHLNLHIPVTLHCDETQKLISQGSLSVDEAAGYICVVDVLIASAMSESISLDQAGEEEIVSMNAAWQQYHSFIKFASNIMSTLLLIVAMRKDDQKASDNENCDVNWNRISEACKSRFEQYLEFTKQFFAQRNSNVPISCRQQVEDIFQFLLRVCSDGWSLEVSGEESKALKLARLQALRAGGEESDFERFVANDTNLDCINLDLAKDLISKNCMNPALNIIFALAVPVDTFSETGKKGSRNWMSNVQFNDIWSKIWNIDLSSGMKFALRSAIGDKLLFKPNLEKMDPVFSLRCELLRKTITEVCKRSSDSEFSYWQQLCSLPCDYSQHSVILPHGISIQDIRKKAQIFLNNTGLTDFEDGSSTDEILEREHIYGNSSVDKLWVIDVCIHAFARLHGRKDVNPNLCDEAERMAANLHSQGNALALISLLCALSPKKYESSHKVFFRRRNILSDVLNLAESRDQQSKAEVAPSLGGGTTTPFLEVLMWAGPGGLDAGMGEDVFYGSSKWSVGEGKGAMMLTKALDEETLTELVEDDFKGVASSVLSLVRFCVRQAREGDFSASIRHANHIMTKLKEMKESKSPAFNQIKHNHRFWSVMFRLVPVAIIQEEKELVETLVLWCFKHSPSTSSCIAFLHYSSLEKIQFVRKFIQGKDCHSKEYPLLFGCSALMESRGTAEEQLKSACKRLPLKQIILELRSLILVLGPQALEGCRGEGDAEVQTSFLGSCLCILVENFKHSKFLDTEQQVLELLKVGAMVEPGCIQPLLEKQVNDVCMKVHRALESGKSGPRDLKDGFASWLERLKDVFHTRPAVASDVVQDLWLRASRRFSLPGGSGQDLEFAAAKQAKTSIRIRGPSLSSEWEHVVGVIKIKVGKRANLVRDLRGMGLL